MIGEVNYSTTVNKPTVVTNAWGGQDIVLPTPTQCQQVTVAVGKVYQIGCNEKPKVVNSGTSTNVILDFYFPENLTVNPKDTDTATDTDTTNVDAVVKKTSTKTTVKKIVTEV
jgi:hypothetical protein